MLAATQLCSEPRPVGLIQTGKCGAPAIPRLFRRGCGRARRARSQGGRLELPGAPAKEARAPDVENTDVEHGHPHAAESEIRHYVYGRWDDSGDRSSKNRETPRPGATGAHWPVRIEAHHPGYLTWEEFVSNQARLRENWNREGSRGVAREGTALLQGLVVCGRCGRKMGVQHHSAHERRSSVYVCQQGYSNNGDTHVCQCMTSRAVDAGVVQAFLDAVSPGSLPVAIRVLDQIEHDLPGSGINASATRSGAVRRARRTPCRTRRSR